MSARGPSSHRLCWAAATHGVAMAVADTLVRDRVSMEVHDYSRE